MASRLSSFQFTALLLSTSCFILVQNSETQQQEETRVELTVPADPTEGAMLSLHCQIWNFNSKDEVLISRTIVGGEAESLSWNKQVRDDDDDRIFIAVRQMPDASVVYFLTLIEVTADDTGNYSCKVISTAGKTADVAADEVEVKVRYFPAENSLNCAPTGVGGSGGISVIEGQEVIVNCSSKSAGFPFVSLAWTRTGSSKIAHTSEVVTKDGQVFSQLRFKASIKDHSTILLCMMTSFSFPDKEQSCHVGPLEVRRSGNSNTPTFPVSETSVHGVSADSETVPTRRTNVHNTDDTIRPISQRCSEFCSLKSSKVWYWIVATVVTGAIALIFLITVLTLFMKIIFRKPASTVHKLPLPRHYSEDIYVDLEGRRSGGEKMYMALEKHDPLDEM